MTGADVRRLAMGFPGVEEGTSYGTPAWRVRKSLVARMHQDGESVVVKVDVAEREATTPPVPGHDV